jgi:hypothetical protein
VRSVYVFIFVTCDKFVLSEARVRFCDPPSSHAESAVVCILLHTATNDSLHSLRQGNATHSLSTHTHITPTRDQSSSRSYARRYSRPTGHRHRLWSPLARFTGRIGSLILACSTLVSCSSLIPHRQKMLLSGLSKTWPSILTVLFTSLKTALLVLTPVSEVVYVPTTWLRR